MGEIEETYCGSNNINNVAWYSGNSGKRTHNVGQKQANGLGLFDMSGNVWEWVEDRHQGSYKSNGANSNPKGPSKGSIRVMRGGSWGRSASYSRSTNHGISHWSYSFNVIGFRLARSI